jgi:hypothetical protein
MAKATKDKSQRAAPAVEKSGDKNAEIVVFSILRESKCVECGAEPREGGFLRMEKERPLCMACADLDHLMFLPSGDTALTRRARKHSTLDAVVVRFSRTRGRYERQGVLVEEAALEQAERECLADADVRERTRARAAAQRADLDEQYVAEFTKRLGDLFPGCPIPERQDIATHACRKYSGRVGRSAAAREFDPTAIELAVRAHIRHCHTPYDRLLARGRDRSDARAAVSDAVDQVFARWQVKGS